MAPARDGETRSGSSPAEAFRERSGPGRSYETRILLDARVERIERDVDALQKSVVPRGEHGEVWAGQRVKDEALQRQIDQVRKEVTDLNTPRDTIQGILRRLDELDRRRSPG